MLTFTPKLPPLLRRAALLLPLLCLSWLAQAQPQRIFFNSGSLSYATTGAADNREAEFRVRQIYTVLSEFRDPIAVGDVRMTQATIDFGDGTAPEPVRLTVLSKGSGGGVFSNGYYIGEYITKHTYAAAGSYVATVRGPRDYSTSDPFVFTTTVGAGAANDSPVAEPAPFVVLDRRQGTPTFQVSARDANGDALTYSLASDAETGSVSSLSSLINPTQLSIDPRTGLLRFNTAGTGSTNGVPFIALIRVSDGATSILLEQNLQLVGPSPINRNPFFVGLTPADGQLLRAESGRALTFTMQAADADGSEVVTLQATGLPANAVLAPALPTGGNPVQTTFTFTPTAAQIGDYQVVFTATDNRGLSTSTGVVINVTAPVACDPNANRPVANADQLTASCGPITITRAQLLGNDTDPQGRPLQITSLGGSNNATIISNPDGTISFIPTPGFVGTTSFSYLLQLAGPVQASRATGHYYEFVSAPGICWNAAKAAAAARTYQGLQGYLTTITSRDEAEFVRGRAAGNYWFGASDAAVEGEWRWQTGPEAGQQFWQGGNSSAFNQPATGAPVAGRYNNWAPGEPNDYKNQYRPAGEDYGSFFGESALWNDLDECGTGSSIAGYVVEYGGLEACTPVLFATGTVTVNVTASPPVARGAYAYATSGVPVTIPASQLLISGIDRDNRPLRLGSVGTPDTGTLVTNADGSFTYTSVPGFVGTARIPYVLQLAGPVQASPATGHYYEFVSAPGVCWSAARAAAAARTYNGLQGYLATITSAAETDFLKGRNSGSYWFGASDNGAEGEWRWQTGPETGQQFWAGAANGRALGFSNWTTGQPDDFKNQYRPAGEDYAQFYGGSGLWNDLDECGTGSSVAGYVVEYGGLEFCTPALYSVGEISIYVNPAKAAAPATATLTAAPATGKAASSAAVLEALPNPSAGQFRLRVSAALDGAAQLDVYDLQGRRVKAVFAGSLRAGETRELAVNAPELAAGVYLVRLQSGSQVQHLRIVVQK